MALFKEDKPAAFVGLVGGALLVLVMVLGVVRWTNAKFEGHGAAAEATE